MKKLIGAEFDFVNDEEETLRVTGDRDNLKLEILDGDGSAYTHAILDNNELVELIRILSEIEKHQRDQVDLR